SPISRRIRRTTRRSTLRSISSAASKRIRPTLRTPRRRFRTRVALSPTEQGGPSARSALRLLAVIARIAYRPCFGFRDFVLSRPQTVGKGRDTGRFPARIGGKIRPKNLLDLAAKRSPFHVHPGSHWWMCAHAGRRTEDQTWHFAKRVTPPNTTSQRRRKWRRKSANSCAATS